MSKVVGPKPRKNTVAKSAKTPRDKTVPDADVSGWHRVFYRATQVERSLPCYGIKPKVGLRLAMLMPTDEFSCEKGASVPSPKFFIGTITKIGDDGDMVTIKFDAAACVSTTLSFAYYAKFCIPYPVQR